MSSDPASTVHAGGVAEHLAHFVHVFNTGDPHAVDQLYTEDAVSVWDPQTPLTGHDRRDSLAEFLTQRPTLKSSLRESFVTGDTALLVTDWSMEIPQPGGGTEVLTGIGNDVVTRGADGNWRFAVDAPYGDPRNAR
jgi:uncharacterized protein (TIGR02246 family)